MERVVRYGLVLVLALGMGMLFTPQAGATATQYYVATTGNDGNDCLSWGTACLTIQAAIDKASGGDTVNVGAGTFILGSQVSINKSISLLGAGAQSTLLQVSGTGYRLNISATGVTVQGFEIEKTDKTGVQNIIYVGASNTTIKDNVIHGKYEFGDTDASRAMEFPYGLSGILIEGNTIYDLRQPAYINGTSTGEIKDNTVYGTRGWVVAGGNLTFTGNEWGSGNFFDIAILVGVSGSHYPDIVALSNANNGAVVEDQRVSPAVLSVAYVDDDAASGGTGGVLYPYQSIGDGVGRVVAGGTVKAAAGTYEEQVEIAKPLTLKGAGPTTIIKSPVTLVKYFVTGTTNNKPVVYVRDTVGVTVEDLTVDGAGRGYNNYRFVGIGFRQAGGTVQRTVIKDVRETPFSGAQHGVGLYVYNDDGTARSIKVYDNEIYGFQKNAMSLNAGSTTPLVVDVTGNTIIGAGATTVIAQNGIQVWGDVATGTIDGNSISGIAYDNTDSATKWVASSILNFYADLDITRNEIVGAHMAIYNYGGAGDLSNNVLEIEKVGVRSYGILATDPPVAVPSPFGDEVASGGGGLLGRPSDDRVERLMSTALDVTVTDNTVTFSGSDKTATYGIMAGAGVDADDISVMIDDNTVEGFTVGVYWVQYSGGTGKFISASAAGNCLEDNTYGMWSNVSYLTVEAERNWWGDASGPYHAVKNPAGVGGEVGDGIDFEPWITDGCGGAATTGNWMNVRTGAYDDLQDSLSKAEVGDTVRAMGGEPLAGGAESSVAGVTVDLDGKTAGAGSPFLKVASADMVVTNGVLDGGGSTSPAILVASGGDNFTLKDTEVSDWADGVQVEASVTSFKLVSNWIHGNAGAGLQIDSGVALGGVVTIEGNLFKVNGGNGIQNDGNTDPLPAEYNSWGDVDGPTATLGDGVSSKVDYDPWTFAEPYLDMDPDTDAIAVSVNEGATFDVKLKVEAEKLYGLTFKITYDAARLAYNGLTLATPWDGQCEDLGSGAGVIAWRCNLLTESEWDGGTVGTISFTAQTGPTGPGPWVTNLDIAHLAADTAASAVGGVKVFVNNAGYNDPSDPDRDITDAEDGQVAIVGLANYTGFVDLQGRTNDGGASVEVYDIATRASAIKLAGASSAASGLFATAHIAPHQLQIGSTYYLYVDRDLFVPTTADLVAAFAHSKLLDTRPLTSLVKLVLRGGDAYNDNVIDISDATCIGNDYGTSSNSCGGPAGSNSDVNEDGKVDILDLTLMGGNYGISASIWAP